MEVINFFTHKQNAAISLNDQQVDKGQTGLSHEQNKKYYVQQIEDKFELLQKSEVKIKKNCAL